jgi:uncharacterized protein (TIGR00106 family)
MQNQVHLAIQIVPVSNKPLYPIIDKAIEVIHASGVQYTVGPMETVMQGSYDDLMEIAKKAQQACLDAGADEVVVTMKVHARKQADVTWQEKNIERSNF